MSDDVKLSLLAIIAAAAAIIVTIIRWSTL